VGQGKVGWSARGRRNLCGVRRGDAELGRRMSSRLALMPKMRSTSCPGDCPQLRTRAAGSSAIAGPAASASAMAEGAAAPYAPSITSASSVPRISISSSRFLNPSPMLTMPQAVPARTTGNANTAVGVLSPFRASATLSVGSQVTTERVIPPNSATVLGPLRQQAGCP